MEEKRDFHKPENQFPLHEAFVGKYVFTMHKICFFWQENQRKWFPLPGKCFSFKIGSPDWFPTAEKKL